MWSAGAEDWLHAVCRGIAARKDSEETNDVFVQQYLASAEDKYSGRGHEPSVKDKKVIGKAMPPSRHGEIGATGEILTQKTVALLKQSLRCRQLA